MEKEEKEIKDKPFKLEVLFEDNHLIAVNKPAGVPTQRDISEDKAMRGWQRCDVVAEWPDL